MGSPPRSEMEVELGDYATLHAFHTSRGIMFALAEISTNLFHQSPGAFVEDVKGGRYAKLHVEDKQMMKRLAQLGIPLESSTRPGATFLSAKTLEEILQDQRKFELVPVLKISLMRMVSQEAAIFIGEGRYKDALPLAMDAIKQGQHIFWPNAPLQLVPLYLLAVQVNLALGRATQCRELLGTAAWLFLQDKSEESHYEVQAELARLFGHLYMLQRRYHQALQAFSEEIYYVSLEHGILDMRTSIGFYNLFKIQKALGSSEESAAFGDVIVEIWRIILQVVVLCEYEDESSIFGKLDSAASRIKLEQSHEQLQFMHLKEILDMLQDICSQREQLLGSSHLKCAEVCFTMGLLYLYLQEKEKALDKLICAVNLYKENKDQMCSIVDKAISKILA